MTEGFFWGGEIVVVGRGDPLFNFAPEIRAFICPTLVPSIANTLRRPVLGVRLESLQGGQLCPASQAEVREVPSIPVKSRHP